MEVLTFSKHGENAVQWRQLWSLAALYGSVVIGWIAYQNYQPKLLDQFQFNDFTLALMVTQGVILVITPPLAGRMGDRYRFKQGHRIPVITAGISFASMIFMAVAFTLFTGPGELWKWILPVLIVFWLIAMSVFTSPALSTMELFIPVDKLPSAMAVLTIVANLIYALEPVIVDIIDFIGAPLTFLSGGIIVLLSGIALKNTSHGLFRITAGAERRPIAAITFDTQRTSHASIFFYGIILGLATTILFNVFPAVFENKFTAVQPYVNGKIFLVGVLVLSALISLPISNLVNTYGLDRSFRISVLLTYGSMAVFFATHSTIILIGATVLFSVAFTALSLSSLPLAMKKANYYEKVFCVGIFFSGVALPDGIVNIIQAW